MEKRHSKGSAGRSHSLQYSRLLARLSSGAAALLALLLMTGCHASDKRILEQLAFINTSSYDLIEREEGGEKRELLRVGLMIPSMDFATQEKSLVLSAVAHTSKEARALLSAQTERILVGGQLRNSLFGESLARSGIWKHIDTLVRDPSIGQRVKITVVEGNALDIMKQTFPNHLVTGAYINEMLNKEEWASVIPATDLYRFTRDYFDDGIDPSAPIIKLTDNHVKVGGIALFRQDQYVAKINLESGIIFSSLCGPLKQGEIVIHLEEGGDVIVNSVVSKRKVKVAKVGKDAEVDIYVKMKASVVEHIGEKIVDSHQGQRELEQKIGAAIEKQAAAVIKTMQVARADCIGIGQHVRNRMSYSDWKALNWNEVFANITIRVHVDMKIKDFGSFK